MTPTANEKHPLVGLMGDKVVTPEKTSEKRALEKAVEEVDEGEKTESSELDDVFDFDFPAHSLMN